MKPDESIAEEKQEERDPLQQEAESRLLEVEARRRDGRLNKEERQRSEGEARLQTVPIPWRKYGPIGFAVAVVLIIFSFVLWWSKRQEAPVKEAEGQKEAIKEAPMVAQPSKEIVAPTPEKKPEAQKEIIKVFRDRLKGGGEGPEMVVIPAGTFQMGDIQRKGSPNERPVHSVTIKSFAIGRYEVTFDEYDHFAKAKKRKLPLDEKRWGRDRRPVINVSWNDAVEYAKWLSVETGKRYRLPSEAEWEYAARGRTETIYWWGNDFEKDMANCKVCENQWDKTAPVGLFKPNPTTNPFGLYDTAGNAQEWVEDCWHGNYNGAPVNGSVWEKTDGGDCGQRVVRGGSWKFEPIVFYDQQGKKFIADQLSSSYRAGNPVDYRNDYTGFRLAQDIE